MGGDLLCVNPLKSLLAQVTPHTELPRYKEAFDPHAPAPLWVMSAQGLHLLCKKQQLKSLEN